MSLIDNPVCCTAPDLPWNQIGWFSTKNAEEDIWMKINGKLFEVQLLRIEFIVEDLWLKLGLAPANTLLATSPSNYPHYSLWSTLLSCPAINLGRNPNQPNFSLLLIDFYKWNHSILRPFCLFLQIVSINSHSLSVNTFAHDFHDVFFFKLGNSYWHYS